MNPINAASATAHQSAAILNFKKYIETQNRIEAIEREAQLATRGNKRAMANILLKPREETAESFVYKGLCGDRDTYMARAQLSATMAIMLRSMDATR